MLFSHNYSILKLFMIGMITVVVLTSCLLWGEWYFERKREFLQEVSSLQEKHISQQKETIRREVDSAIDIIRYNRKQFENRVKNQLKNRVYEAHQVATHLYQKYRGEKSDQEIFSLIKETLRAIRFNDGRGYFFATNMNGVEELFSGRPAMEGQNILDIQDAQGTYIIREMIDLIKTEQEGFYRYAWTKPNQGNRNFQKISFIKYFAPANWFIGTGDYADDLEQDIKTEVLQRITEIRFGKEGFLFVVDKDSRTIAHPKAGIRGVRMLDAENPGIRAAFPEMLERTAETGRAYIEYRTDRLGQDEIAEKISYVARLPEWQWLVGAGFYLDTLEAEIAEKREHLRAVIYGDTWRLLALSLFLIFCSLIIVRQLSRKFQHNLSLFNSFFEKAASSSTKIEKNAIIFSEFEQIAQAANRMIDERSRSEEEKRQLESQLLQSQKLEAIGTLAGGIAHDFNNLLASIFGNLSLLSLRLEKGDKRRLYVERLTDAAEKAKDLVFQILSFSRYSDTKGEVVDLAACISESLRLLRSSIPSSVSITAQLPDQICPVLINKTQFHQVLMNLCSNAFQALPAQTGRISLQLDIAAGDELPQTLQQLGTGQKQFAHLSVNDDGCGIETETLDKIFDPFFSTKEIDQGTGLGLSIAHRIISRFQGLIDVQSKPGVGTTFHIYLPLTESLPLAADTQTDSEPIKGSGNILLVDDDFRVLESTTEQLQQLGYQVNAFSHPDQALGFHRANPDKISLVLTDQTMPGMTGIKLIKKIRELDRHLPIVLCSGYSEQFNEEINTELNISHFLMKPITLLQLSQTLSKLIR